VALSVCHARLLSTFISFSLASNHLEKMSCPHGHASRADEEHGSGECYTCLEQPADYVCACNHCVAGLKKRIENPESTNGSQNDPQWWLNFIKAQIGGTVTQENYREALQLYQWDCTCAKDVADHGDEECIAEECYACAMVRCPHHEPLHFHHDGCPACTDC
jgi:hypothetical protein